MAATISPPAATAVKKKVPQNSATRLLASPGGSKRSSCPSCPRLSRRKLAIMIAPSLRESPPVRDDRSVCAYFLRVATCHGMKKASCLSQDTHHAERIERGANIGA